MLHRRRHNPVAGLQNTKQAEVNGLGGVGGKSDPGCISDTKEARHGFATLHDQPTGLQGELMTATSRIGGIQAQGLFDRFDHLRWFWKRGRSVVEVDWHESERTGFKNMLVACCQGL